MKAETFNLLWESAYKKFNKESAINGELEHEIVLVPVVITKRNGRVGMVSGVDTDIIFDNENKDIKRDFNI